MIGSMHSTTLEPVKVSLCRNPKLRCKKSSIIEPHFSQGFISIYSNKAAFYVPAILRHTLLPKPPFCHLPSPTWGQPPLRTARGSSPALSERTCAKAQGYRMAMFGLLCCLLVSLFVCVCVLCVCIFGCFCLCVGACRVWTV